MFTEHAHKLVEVANLACSMSNNDDGVKMVRYAASQIENLCPQVDIIFWPQFYIVVIGMTFFMSRQFFHILFEFLFPFSLWTFVSIFYLDFYFHFLFGHLFLFKFVLNSF